MTTLALRRTRVPFPLAVTAAVVAWTIAWFAAAPFAAWFTFDLLGLQPESHLGEAVARPNRGSEQIAGSCGMALPAEVTGAPEASE